MAADGDRRALHFRKTAKFNALTWNAVSPPKPPAGRRAGEARREAGRSRRCKPRKTATSGSCSTWRFTMARGIHVAVHATLTGPQIAWQIANCGTKLVVVSGPEQGQKLAAAAAEIPKDVKFVSFDNWRRRDSRPARRSSSRRSRPTCTRGSRRCGSSKRRPSPKHQARRSRHDPLHLGHDRRTQGRDALASQPDVELPRRDAGLHGRSRRRAAELAAAVAHFRSHQRLLPVDLLRRQNWPCAPAAKRSFADCQAIKPHYLNGVPYFFDKVMRTLHEKGLADMPRRAARPRSAAAIKMCCAGGARLADHVNEFFTKSGVTLVQGYGLTESSPVDQHWHDRTTTASARSASRSTAWR